VAGQWWPKAIAQRREAPLTRRHQPLRQWGDRSEAGGRKPGPTWTGTAIPWSF